MSNSICELDLISRILNSEDVFDQHEIYKHISKLEKLINIDYEELIEKSTYLEKTKSIEELNELHNVINSFIMYPMMIGKTVIGVISDNKRVRNNIMLNDFCINESKFNLEKNNLIPTIYYNGEESLNILNKFDFFSEITPKDISILLNEIVDKRNIDIRGNISAILNSQENISENIVVIYLPKLSDENSKLFKTFINMTDCILLDNKNVQDNLDHLCGIRYDNKVYLKTVPSKKIN
ncbi:MAG: hypothetical protein R3Y64_09230, partial [Peptostreptococcaceae bacterium]